MAAAAAAAAAGFTAAASRLGFAAAAAAAAAAADSPGTELRAESAAGSTAGGTERLGRGAEIVGTANKPWATTVQ